MPVRMAVRVAVRMAVRVAVRVAVGGGGRGGAPGPDPRQQVGDQRAERGEVVERHAVLGLEPVSLAHFTEQLRLADAVDPQVGLEVGIELDDLRRIARLLDHELDQKLLDLRRVGWVRGLGGWFRGCRGRRRGDSRHRRRDRSQPVHAHRRGRRRLGRRRVAVAGAVRGTVAVAVGVSVVAAVAGFMTVAVAPGCGGR